MEQATDESLVSGGDGNQFAAGAFRRSFCGEMAVGVES